MTLWVGTSQDPGGRGSATCEQEISWMGEGCLSPTGSILNQAQVWSLRWETSMGVEASWSGWLSHLVKLSSRSISIRKGGLWCLGLSPCDDRVHKCGQVQEAGLQHLCWQCWVPQLSLCWGWPTPTTHAAIRNSSYLPTAFIFTQYVTSHLAGLCWETEAKHTCWLGQHPPPFLQWWRPWQPVFPGCAALCALGLDRSKGGSSLTSSHPSWDWNIQANKHQVKRKERWFKKWVCL